MAVRLRQKRHPRKKTNAKAATPVVTALKVVVKDAVANVAKAVMADEVVTAVASVRVSAQANAMSAQKAHRQKRVNLVSRVKPAPRAKAAATSGKSSVRVNALVSAQSARRVNAARP